VVRASETPNVPAFFFTNQRPAVTADIVKGVRFAVFGADDQDRIGIDFDAEEIAGFWNLTRVAGKKPSAPPDTRDVEFVYFGIRIKRTKQTVTGGLMSD
jgi:hypothetical protein